MTSQTSTMIKTSTKPTIGILVPGLLAIAVAALIALTIQSINDLFSDSPERAVLVVGGLFSGCLLLMAASYLLWYRQRAIPSDLVLITLGIVSIFLVAIYLYRVSFYITFPADILIWSENDFINDILKFRIGYPIYTDQINNESFIYMPGAQLLTYLLAWISGYPTSIMVYRIIQIIYLLLTTIIAGLCVWQLVKLSQPEHPIENRLLLSILWLPFLFLMAGNDLTNPFVHLLHNDSLAQLISIIAYWLLLQYITTRNPYLFVPMILISILGFAVKQSLIIWTVFYALHLAVFDSNRSLVQALKLALFSFIGVGLIIAYSYWLWGEYFFYWIFTVLSEHGLSPLRSFQHALDTWAYLTIGFVGGMVLLRTSGFKQLLGPWLIWLIFISLEIYTSGIAWMLNHIGPGSLIAGIWFCAALTQLWPMLQQMGSHASNIQRWIFAGIVLAIVCLLFSGLHLIRIPLKPISDDAYRYIKRIEDEFKKQPTKTTLLDMGSWIYMKEGVIMKDRVPSIGDRGYGQTGDFSGILERLNSKYYAKIMVRNLHSPDFHYDHVSWAESSGIRQAILANYYEVGQIAAVKSTNYQHQTYFLEEISILIPKIE